MSWTPQVSARHMRITAVSLYALNMNFEGRRFCVACFFTCLFICLFVPENRAPLLGLSEQGVRSIPYIKRCMLRVSLLRFHRAPCYLATKRRSYARAQKLAAHSRMQWFDCIGMPSSLPGRRGERSIFRHARSQKARGVSSLPQKRKNG